VTPAELVAEYERTHYQGDPKPGFEGEEHSLLALAKRVRFCAVAETAELIGAKIIAAVKHMG
jgi:hypothetical protein